MIVSRSRLSQIKWTCTLPSDIRDMTFLGPFILGDLGGDLLESDKP